VPVRAPASRPLVLLVALAACGDDPAPAKGDTGPKGGGGVDTQDPVVETPEAPDSVDVGGFTLSGRVMRERSTGRRRRPLRRPRRSPPARHGGPDAEFVALVDAVTASDGGFTFDDVPMPSTAGYYLRAYDCAGDDSVWFPTITLLLQDPMAGLGPSDRLDGVSAWIATADDVAMVDAAIADRGAPDSILDVGALWGQTFDTDGSILAPAGIRGPDGTRVHYDQGDGTWLAYDNTAEEGDGRWVSPGAPYALWTCRAQAHNVPSVIAGAVPGWVVHWDYRATEDFSVE